MDEDDDAGRRGVGDDEAAKRRLRERAMQALRSSTALAAATDVVEDDPTLTEEERMKRVLGFESFDSTKGKPVPDNLVGPSRGFARTRVKFSYRQYMNRKRRTPLLAPDRVFHKRS